MFFSRSSHSIDPAPEITLPGLRLRTPVMSDFPAWAKVRADSREFLRPWEPVWPENDLTKASFRRRLRRYQKERIEGRALSLLLFLEDTDEIVGGMSLANIRRGVSQSVTLGYWMGVNFAGKGYMSRAVTAVLPFCFNNLDLHRVEAACLPNNQRSMKLLQKVGFRQEGYARNYLLINGRWQDHVVFACLAEDFVTTADSSGFSLGGKVKETL